MANIGRGVSDFFSDEVHKGSGAEMVANTHGAATFIQSTVIPAFEEVRARLQQEGREVRITNHQTSARMEVVHQGQHEFSYTVRTRMNEERAQAVRETTGRHGGNAPTGGGPLLGERGDREGTNIDEVSREQVVQHILSAYEAERTQQHGRHA